MYAFIRYSGVLAHVATSALNHELPARWYVRHVAASVGRPSFGLRIRRLGVRVPPGARAAHDDLPEASLSGRLFRRPCDTPPLALPPRIPRYVVDVHERCIC